jgi:hypothetical protein
MTFNLDQVQPGTDLWLREGDVIEIPERDPNAARAVQAGESAVATPAGSIPPSPIRLIPTRQLKSP